MIKSTISIFWLAIYTDAVRKNSLLNQTQAKIADSIKRFLCDQAIDLVKGNWKERRNHFIIQVTMCAIFCFSNISYVRCRVDHAKRYWAITGCLIHINCPYVKYDLWLKWRHSATVQVLDCQDWVDLLAIYWHYIAYVYFITIFTDGELKSYTVSTYISINTYINCFMRCIV